MVNWHWVDLLKIDLAMVRFKESIDVIQELDATLALIKATVQIDQPIGEGRRVVGTGFFGIGTA